MIFLTKAGLAFLLLVISIVPCPAELSHNKERDLSEPLRGVGERGHRVQSSISTRNSHFLKTFVGLWSESWPSIIKSKHESGMEYGFPGSAEQPYAAVSKSCLQDVYRLAYDIILLDGWALTMLDASGKFPSGTLLGDVQWLGIYGECLEISSQHSQWEQPDNNSTVFGRYCLVNIGNDSPSNDSEKLELHYGICIPQNCSSTDALALINLVFSVLTDEIHATVADCSDNNALPLDSDAVAVIVILCILGSFLLLGTCLDLINNHWFDQTDVNEYSQDGLNGYNEESLLLDRAQRLDRRLDNRGFDTDGALYQFLVAFSVLANAKKILYLERKQKNRNLEVLHGMRFFSMSWIVLFHTHLFAYTPTKNPRDALKMSKRFSYQTVLNSTVSIDTFFVLSATLASYLLLREIRSKGGLQNISWPKFYFHRFWRLTPLYMLVLAIYTALYKYFGNGPYWQKESDESCRNNWWTNLLYINNIVSRDSMCLGWTWYLASDMQFFLLMPLFVALLYKWTLFGRIVIFVVMLVSSITTGVITYNNDYPPTLLEMWPFDSLGIRWLHDVYSVPWCRINPYLIGILLGYTLYKCNCKMRINRVLVVLGWCLAAACNLSVLYGLHNFYNGDHLGASVNALYASVHRTAWAVGVAWVILACATGNGGLVNKLLTIPIMLPLSRLTYAAYLVHPVVISWYYEGLKVPLFVNDTTMVYLFFGHLLLSYLCGFVLSIIAEVPMINLERSFLSSHDN